MGYTALVDIATRQVFHPDSGNVEEEGGNVL